MRHRIKKKKLNRDAANRKALRFSLTKALVENKSVKTTLKKAKFVRPFVEKIVTKAADDGVSTRRYLLKRLRNDKEVVDKLMEEIGPKYSNRNGGYLRIRRLAGTRKGDNAQMAVISWVEENNKNKDSKNK